MQATMSTEKEIREKNVMMVEGWKLKIQALLEDINRESKAGFASRELSLGYTRIEEGSMWLIQILKREDARLAEITKEHTLIVHDDETI